MTKSVETSVSSVREKMILYA